MRVLERSKTDSHSQYRVTDGFTHWVVVIDSENGYTTIATGKPGSWETEGKTVLLASKLHLRKPVARALQDYHYEDDPSTFRLPSWD